MEQEKFHSLLSNVQHSVNVECFKEGKIELESKQVNSSEYCTFRA